MMRLLTLNTGIDWSQVSIINMYENKYGNINKKYQEN